MTSDFDKEIAAAAKGLVGKEPNPLKKIADAVAPSGDKLAEADKTLGILTLVKGQLEDGNDFYAYLSIAPSRHQAFLEAESKGGYRLEDYGTVLASGEGTVPPPEVVEEMYEKYGANPNFENDLLDVFTEEIQDIIGDED